MGAARYEVLSTLPPGAGTRTRLAWQTGDAGFRRAVVLREVPEGAEVGVAAPAQEGVLPLLDLVELDGQRWVVFEFVPGVTFGEVTAAHFSVERLPSLGLIGRVVVDACRAIHRVHAWADPLGLQGPQKHGGLSDASIFVGFDGLARILDLNARRLGRFIAPELTRGDVFDARADVFSLGAVLHHATTRFEKGYAVTVARAPSQTEFPPPSAVHPEATVELDSVVMRALMPSPSSRFASALELAEELEQAIGPAIFTHEQVNTVLTPLFGDRMAALKDLVDPKRRPLPPRSSAPRPAARKPGNALDEISAYDVKLDGEMGAEIEDIPTQANISIPRGASRPSAPVPDFDPHATGPGKAQPRPDFDPHATTPRRALSEAAARHSGAELRQGSRPSRPSAPSRKDQTEEDRARAQGQEKISTADLDPDQISHELKALQGVFDEDEPLGQLGDQPTNIKPRASHPSMAALQTTPRAPVVDAPLYEDPKKREATLDVDRADSPPAGVPRGSRTAKAFIGLLLLVAVAAAGANVVRPDLKGQIWAQLQPLLSRVTSGSVDEPGIGEDGGVGSSGAGATTDGGEFEDEGDGGEEEDLAVLGGADGKGGDAGVGKHPGPAHKKKKKSRVR